MYIYENNQNKQNKQDEKNIKYAPHTGRALYAYIVASSLSFATRFDISILVLIAGAFILWPILKHKIWQVYAGIAALSFALIPFLWFEPIIYLKNMLGKVGLHALHIQSQHSFMQVLLEAPWPFISFFIGVGLYFFRKDLLPIPPRFMKWLLASTVGLWIMISIPKHHPDWFYFQFFGIWMILLPIFFISILDEYKARPSLPWLNARLLKISLITVLIGAQIVPLILLFLKVPFYINF